MITLFTGRMGSGKTMIMSYYGGLEWLKGRIIFSNYETKFSTFLEGDNFYINNREECLYLMDQTYLYLDDKNKSLINNFLARLDKLDVYLSACSGSKTIDKVKKEERLDSRIIQNIKTVYYCEYNEIKGLVTIWKDGKKKEDILAKEYFNLYGIE